MIVAIDGPASSGKSTTARAVADRLGFLYLDTGAMYRAVALAFLRRGRSPTPEEAEAVLPEVHVGIGLENGQMRVFLNGEDVTDCLRRQEVSEMSSRVSALEAVREKLVREQRRIAAEHEASAEEGQEGGVILDGRDIGTVVFPEADLKIFLVADVGVRARRRHMELKEEEGPTASLEDVRARIEQRDRQDRRRAASPLRKASDALEFDTTDRTIEEQVDFVVARVRERQARSSG